VENLVESKQFLLFTFEQTADRNARPTGDNFGDFVGRDFFPEKVRALVSTCGFGFEFFELFFDSGILPY
jgi:hypothetical protein